MLTDLDRKKIKASVGKRYSSKVLKILQEKGVCKPNGEPYSNTTVVAVFNNVRENKEIELALWEAKEKADSDKKLLSQLKK